MELRDRNNASVDDLEEIAEIGKSLKKRKSLSSSEKEVLQEICDDYRVQNATLFLW